MTRGEEKMGNSSRCKVCKVMWETQKGCMTEHGFVCQKCVGHWLQDYIRMVNPFVHLQGDNQNDS